MVRNSQESNLPLYENVVSVSDSLFSFIYLVTYCRFAEVKQIVYHVYYFVTLS